MHEDLICITANEALCDFLRAWLIVFSRGKRHIFINSSKALFSKFVDISMVVGRL